MENFGRRNFGRRNFGRRNFGRRNFGGRNFGRRNFGRRNFGGPIIFQKVFVFCRKRTSYRKSRKNPSCVLIQ